MPIRFLQMETIKVIDTLKKNDITQYQKKECMKHNLKKILYICSDIICIEENKCLLCHECYKSHNVDHKMTKLMPASEVFSDNLLNDINKIEKMVESELKLIKENNVDTFKKIDRIYVELMKNLHSMLLSSCEQVKQNVSGIKRLSLDLQKLDKLKEDFVNASKKFNSLEDLKSYLHSYSNIYNRFSDFDRLNPIQNVLDSFEKDKVYSKLQDQTLNLVKICKSMTKNIEEQLSIFITKTRDMRKSSALMIKRYSVANYSIMPSIADTTTTTMGSFYHMSISPRSTNDVKTSQIESKAIEIPSSIVGKVLYVEECGKIAIQTEDCTVLTWDIFQNRIHKKLKSHAEPITNMINLENGRIATSSKDKMIKLWNVETGVVEKTLRGHVGKVNELCLISDLLLISCDEHCILKIWDITKIDIDACIKTIEMPIVVKNMICINNKEIAFSNGSEITFYDLEQGLKLASVNEHTKEINHLAFVPDINGDLISSSSEDRTIKLWSCSTRSYLRTFSDHKYGVVKSFLIREDVLISLTRDDNVKFWSISKNICIRTISYSKSAKSVWLDVVNMNDGLLGVTYHHNLIGFTIKLRFLSI